MIDKNNSNNGEWIKGAIIGAITVPMIIAVLSLCQMAFSYDSKAYEAIHLVVYYGSWPVLKLVFATLHAFGVTGDGGLAYIFPIFTVIFLYWVVIGFILGAVLGMVRFRRRKAQPAAGGYADQPDANDNHRGGEPQP